ncbi:MAG: Cof-type HAD-IIB family hydrolase [Bacillota bacterium]
MNIKMAVLDLDDTLLNKELKISDRNSDTIARAAREGVKIILGSGRMLCSIRPFHRLLGLDTPIVSYNGAMIAGPDQGEAMFHAPVPLEYAGEIVDFFKTRGMHINVYVDDKLYVEEINPLAVEYAGRSAVPLHEAGDLLRFLRKPPTKVLVIDRPVVLDEMIEPLRVKYGHALFFTKSDPSYLEILAKGINKGTAVKFLTRYYRLRREEVMAIGNALNDMEMIEAAGWGVAVGNAVPGLKAKADWVAPASVEDGVAVALERILCKNMPW